MGKGSIKGRLGKDEQACWDKRSCRQELFGAHTSFQKNKKHKWTLLHFCIQELISTNAFIKASSNIYTKLRAPLNSRIAVLWKTTFPVTHCGIQIPQWKIKPRCCHIRREEKRREWEETQDTRHETFHIQRAVVVGGAVQNHQL